MIPCEVMHDLILLYDEKSLSDAGMKFVAEHLKECPECRKYLKSIRTSKAKQDRVSEVCEQAANTIGQYNALMRRIRIKRAIMACAVGTLLAASILKNISDEMKK